MRYKFTCLSAWIIHSKNIERKTAIVCILYTRNKFINLLLLLIAVTGKWIKCTQYHRTSNIKQQLETIHFRASACVLDKPSEIGNSINLYNSSLFSHPVHLNRNNKQTNFQLKTNENFTLHFMWKMKSITDMSMCFELCISVHHARFPFQSIPFNLLHY